MLGNKIQNRFQELQDKSKEIESYRSGNEYASYVWLSWATSAQDLIKSVYGQSSPYYTNFVESMENSKTTNGYVPNVTTLVSIFRSAKEAFEGGYVFDVQLSLSGEVLGDFVVLAKEALNNGYKDVAAVLASAALEDALKRYARVIELDVEDATMTETIKALKSKGHVSGARKSLLDAMPSIRNNALHARWEKIDEASVNGIIAYVEHFLLTNFT